LVGRPEDGALTAALALCPGRRPRRSGCRALGHPDHLDDWDSVLGRTAKSPFPKVA